MKFKNLGRYGSGRQTGSKLNLSIPLPKTPVGRTYRYSPNETAQPRHFLIGQVVDRGEISDADRARMKLAPGSPQTVCPYSGIIADDQAFTHPDDQAAALKIVKQAALADIHEHLNQMFSGIARKSGGALTYKPGQKPATPRPRFQRRDLLRELVCDHCHRDYGVYAIGLFCPDCGAPNLRLHFAREVELVEAQVEIAENLPTGNEELAYRLLGNAHEDVLTAFEATLKTVYLYGIAQRPVEASPVKPVANDFQNVEKATKRFAQLGFDPFSGLAETETETLLLNIQKRHLVGHNLGIVDAKFAEHARNAKIGETVNLLAADIRIFARLCQQVVDVLDAWLAGGLMASNAGKEPAIIVELQAAPPPPQAAPDGMQLDDAAVRIGRWLAASSINGRAGSRDLAELPDDLRDLTRPELDEALAELAAEGLITTTRFIGGDLPRVSVTLDLYAAFDPSVCQHDPNADAAALAVAVLGMDAGISVEALHGSVDWPLRRFNPALGLLISYIGEGRVSRTWDDQYVVRHFSLNADDRVALKRFARQMGVEA